MYIVVEVKTGKKKGQFSTFVNARKRKNNLEACPSNKGKKYEIKEWSNREKTEGGLKAVFLWNVTDPRCVEATGQENNYVRDEIFLQLTDDGKLDLSKGKNIALGKRLEAVGLNKGASWSFDMMLERQAVIRVKHRIDSRDNETKYAEVAAIAPL